MKKFIADMHLLDNCEINFFTAFRCDKNQIFYQAEDSPDWLRLKQHIYYQEISNPERYAQDLKGLHNLFCMAASATYDCLEESNVMSTIYSMTKNNIYYNMKRDIGHIQYKYWLSINKHEYKKMIALYNAANGNQLIRKASAGSYDKIAIDQELFFPMIAKVYDMQESQSYDGLTQEIMQ